ncbi:hypothetical protein CVT24_012669 [Panaeolus cyanescens]|uniref:Uncharacterized protein n=1 Tax=Panaeolus cyanescens TaxID=181874 RepID=A0A409YKE8_9AGAR|nr:hypothetical protein CVT24_012669 [Panaeolus cyanescens]
MPSNIMNAHERRLEDKKLYYLRNRAREQEKARKRAHERRKNETPEEAQQRQEKHREAQARYRARNRDRLCLKAWQYRSAKKRQQAMDKDEAEFQRLMALEEDE